MPLRSPIFFNGSPRHNRREQLLDLRELAVALIDGGPVTLDWIARLKGYEGASAARQSERRFLILRQLADELGSPIWRPAPDGLRSSADQPGRWRIVTEDPRTLLASAEAELEIIARTERHERRQRPVRTAREQKKIDFRTADRAMRMERGLCAAFGCPNEAQDETLFCRACRLIQADQTKQRRDHLKEIGVCVVCGRERAEAGGILGPACAERQREYLREYHADRARRGVCQKCGVKTPAEGKSTCEDCLEVSRLKQTTPEFRSRRQEIKEERRSKGFCSSCWTKAVPGKTLCQKHLDYARQKQAEYTKKRKAR